MKFRRVATLLGFLLTVLTPCFAHHLAVVVNKDNNVDNVTAAHLAKIVRAEVKNWPDGKSIILVLHRDSAGETETLQHLNKMSAAEWKGLIAAHKDSIQVADSGRESLPHSRRESQAARVALRRRCLCFQQHLNGEPDALRGACPVRGGETGR